MFLQQENFVKTYLPESKFVSSSRQEGGKYFSVATIARAIRHSYAGTNVTHSTSMDLGNVNLQLCEFQIAMSKGALQRHIQNRFEELKSLNAT